MVAQSKGVDCSNQKVLIVAIKLPSSGEAIASYVFEQLGSIATVAKAGVVASSGKVGISAQLFEHSFKEIIHYTFLLRFTTQAKFFHNFERYIIHYFVTLSQNRI